MKKVIIIIMIALILIAGIFLFIFFKDGLEKENIVENDNTPIAAPQLPSNIKIPGESIDLSNFESAERIIKKQELVGEWQSESQDFIGEVYPLEGIIFILKSDDTYERKLNGELFDSGFYSLENNTLYLSEKKDQQNQLYAFINIKNNKLILVYPEYPKAEIYKRI